MEYHEIRAENTEKALSIMRKKYGENARPIAFKYKKKKGFFGLFNKNIAVLTVGIDENYVHFMGDEKKKQVATISQMVKANLLNKREKVSTFNNILSSRNDVNTQRFEHQNEIEKKLNDLIRIVSELQKNEKQESVERKKVFTTQEEYDFENKRLKILEKSQQRSAFKNVEGDIERQVVYSQNPFIELDEPLSDSESITLEYLRERLYINEFSVNCTNDIIEYISNSLLDTKRIKKKKIRELLNTFFSEILKNAKLKISSSRKNIVVLIGPTGVGKTTTIAKMASNLIIQGKEIDIVTVDYLRIGAALHLKEYAEILDVPFHVIRDGKEDFKNAIENSSSNIIFVDTFGTGETDQENFSALAEHLDYIKYDKEIILTLSANAKTTDLIKYAREFSKMKYSKLIITKIDETDTYGNIFSVLRETNFPVIYFTNGQEVPNNIIASDQLDLTERTINSILEVDDV